VEVVNELWNKTKKGINEAAGKIIGKEERLQRNSWFDEERQMTLENKKGAYNKAINRNTKQN
jgi:hypothetical protein